MKKHLMFTLLAFGFITMPTSCGKTKDDICDLDKVCYTTKPDELYIRLEMSTNPTSKPIEVSLYKGYLDDGELYEKFYTAESAVYYLMPVGERYTATAKYLDGNDEILVVDSDKLSTVSYKNCDETCYDWDDEITLDLKLAK